jgi:hypothetical protein
MKEEKRTVRMDEQKRGEWKCRGRKGGRCKRGQTNIIHA